MGKYKIEIKWAIIFIAVMLLWVFLEKMMCLHSDRIDKHATFTNLIAIPAIAVYTFALLDKKRNYYNGAMNYKQGFICGLIITAIVTILSPLTQYVTSEIITPNYFANAIRYSVDAGKMELAAAEKYFNLKSYIMQALIGTPIMGIITTAIVAIFTRSKGRNNAAPASNAKVGIT